MDDRRIDSITTLLSYKPFKVHDSAGFFKIYFIDYAITVVPFPPSLHSILPTPPSHIPHP